ncbi:tRNA pseudouridine(38-40) synthase TruA [Phytohalomonas tamaricis]|uniref:tRNA pseudouridine(38-40) synthase TruA n=1 Tax=Phytohalomonas tamaricis TaxID=2081032 RepID=UPI000D0B6AAB|nr:tRNA pseudouridine(38-40) synthase TruA [Phytohalomonas tamaricis]
MSLFSLLDERTRRAGRIALGVEYNGASYYGWQRLSHGPSIQAALETALAKVASQPITVMCSGRTDSGVHATRQIVHFDTETPRTQKAWVMGVNANLPSDIVVHWAHFVPDDFHARFCALARRYRYVIMNRATPSALSCHDVTWHRTPLDERRMHEAAQALIGEHDFSGYRAAGCQSTSPWRHVHFAEVRRYGPLVVIDIQANAFLHHMIRNIAGVLMAIGDGRQDIGWCREILEHGVRAQGGVTAPAQGLHFVDARYDDHFGLPEEPLGPDVLLFTGEWSGERAVPEGTYVRQRRLACEQAFKEET